MRKRSSGDSIVGCSLPEALSGSSPGHLGFETAPLAGFQVECVLLGVGDDAFACHLSLEAPNRAFDVFVVVNLYSCHSLPPRISPAARG